MAGLFDHLIPNDPGVQGAPAPAPKAGLFDHLIPAAQPEVEEAPQPGFAERMGMMLGDVLAPIANAPTGRENAPRPYLLPGPDISLGKIAEGVKTGFGDEPLGMSEKTRGQLGPMLAQPGQTPGPLQAINETIVPPIGAVVDTALRGFNALNFGAAETAGQVAENAGATPTDANRLRRDANIIAQVAPFAVMGADPTAALANRARQGNLATIEKPQWPAAPEEPVPPAPLALPAPSSGPGRAFVAPEARPGVQPREVVPPTEAVPVDRGFEAGAPPVADPPMAKPLVPPGTPAPPPVTPIDTLAGQTARRAANQDRMAAKAAPVDMPAQPMEQRPGNAPFADAADVGRDRRVADNAGLVEQHLGVRPEQFAELPVEAREQLVAAAQRKATAERPNAEPLRVGDDAQGVDPYSVGDRPTAPRNVEGQSAGERLTGERATDRVQSDGSERPFRADSTDGATPDQVRGFEDRARAQAEQARAETVEDLQRRWEERARNGRDQRDTGAEDAYRESKKTDFSNRAAPQDTTGNFVVDEFGLVKSDKGGPVRYGTQKQAASWIINEGQKLSKGGQYFEVVNHPKGGFSVRERGRNPGPETPPPQQPGPGPRRSGGDYLPPPRDTPPAPRPSDRPSGSAEPVIREEGPQPLDPRSVADVTRNPDVVAPRTRNIIDRRRNIDGKPNPNFGQPRTINEEVVVKRGDSPYEAEPRRPASIIDAVKEAGGIRPADLNGDLAQIFDGRKNAAREVIRKDGKQLDYVREAMIERGYLPEGASIRDLYDAMDRDQRARAGKNDDGRVFSAQDAEYIDNWRAVKEHNDQIHELARNFGIDEAGLTAEKFWRIAEERLDFEERARMSHDYAEARAADYTKAESLEQMERARAEETPAGDYELKPRAEPEAPAGRAGAKGDVPNGGEPANARGRESDVPARDRGVSDPGAAREAVGKDQAARSDAADRSGGEPRLDLGPEAEAKPLSSTKEQLEASQLGRKGSDKVQERPEGGLFGEVKRLFADESGSVSGKWLEDYARSIADWQQDMKSLLTRAPKGEQRPSRNIGRAYLYSSAGWMESIAGKYKSPTLDGVLASIQPPAGRAAGAGRGLHESIAIEYNTRASKLHEPLKDFLEDKPQLEQIVKQVQNPGSINPKTPIGQAATALTKWLADQHAYMKAAGVDVGKVERGYYPRMVDKMAVLKNPAAFRTKAEAAFRAEGMTAADAAAAASDWSNRVMLGDMQPSSVFFPVAGEAQAAFLKGRVLGKGADAIMRDFMIQDPRVALTQYAQATVKRAETARLFGDGWSKWSDIEAKIKAEGGAASIGPLRDYIRTVAGISPPASDLARGVMPALNAVRTVGTLGYLEGATIASLPEPFLAGVRTGNVLDTARSLKNLVVEQFNSVRGSKSGLRKMAEDWGAISAVVNDTMQSARFGADTGIVGNKLQQKFFTRIWLEQYTRDTITSSIGVGRVFIRRLAHDVTEGGATRASSINYLAELGVPKDKAEAFAKAIVATNKGWIEPGMLKGADAELFQTAITRFSRQTVMAPNASTAPIWASSGFGKVINQFMAYGNAFTREVLTPLARKTKDAATPGNGLEVADRLRMMGPLLNMPVYVAAVAGVMGLKDAGGDAIREVAGVPRDKPKKDESVADKTAKLASRAGLFGNLDSIYNALSSLRYDSDVTTRMVGPVLGGVAGAAKVGGNLIFRNSENTNTAERAAAKAVYSTFVEPAVNVLLGMLPGSSIAAAAATQAVGAGAAKDAFATALTGPPKRSASSAGRGGRDSGRGTGRGHR